MKEESATIRQFPRPLPQRSQMSVQDLATLREVILEVIDDAPRLIWESQFTALVADQDAIINEQRLRLCDAIQDRLTDRLWPELKVKEKGRG